MKKTNNKQINKKANLYSGPGLSGLTFLQPNTNNPNWNWNPNNPAIQATNELPNKPNIYSIDTSNVDNLNNSHLLDNTSPVNSQSTQGLSSGPGPGAYLNAGKTALDLTTSAIGNLKPDTYNAQQYNAGSFDSLQAQANSYIPTKANTQSVAGNAAKGALKGAEAGMAFGPWGAAIGGAIGGLSQGITTAIGNKKQIRAANEAHNRSMMNLSANAQNINKNNSLNQQSMFFNKGGNLFADGGFTNNVNMFNQGGTHEQNPNMGIQQGIGQNGLPNLVEEGEIKYNDYIFSNRLIANEDILDIVKLPTKYDGKTFAEIAELIQKESEERPNDPISKNGLEDSMLKLQEAQEIYKLENPEEGSLEDESMQMNNFNNASLNNPNLMNIDNSQNPKQMISEEDMMMQQQDNQEDMMTQLMQGQMMSRGGNLFLEGNKLTFPKLDSSQLRYTPIIASGIQTLSDSAKWTNKEDTSYGDMVSNQSINIPRLTEKMVYKPLDTMFLQNQANAQQAATRSSLMNISGGNRANLQASLIGANYSGGLQAGDLERKSQENQINQLQRILEFNRQTSQFNSEADKVEQLTRMQNIIQGGALREKAITDASTIRNANRNVFLNSMTGLGQEAMNRNMITSNPALYYTLDSDGYVTYKNSDVERYAKANGMTFGEALMKFQEDSKRHNMNVKNQQ